MYAHSVKDQDKDTWQPLAEHLQQVAELARGFASVFGAGQAAALAGILHDLGKYSAAFQRRLEGGKTVDHATAGAQHAMALKLSGWDDVMAQLVAHAVAGHHAGLDDRSALNDRLTKPIEPLDPSWRQEIAVEASGLMAKLAFDKPSSGFQLAFLGRMIFSCLIDADRRNTAAFEARAKGLPDETDAWPALPQVIDRLIEAFDAHMDLKPREGDINALRHRILGAVRAKADLPPGLFTLTVPTGGGKTLASLGFALDHAKAKGLRRIIYAIPFTSVIDQTVDIFSQLLGPDMVLAHHSGLDIELADKEAEIAEDPTKKLRLAMADWGAPVVVTTNVQFFESLFSHRPSRCRKLHNIAKSVIVLDEAQTIPLQVLRPCLAALNELVKNYGCSIVICTATQPAITEPGFKGGLVIKPGHELAPDPKDLHSRLKRVIARHAGVMTDADLVGALAEVPNGLVIVNTRAHALTLFKQAEAAGLGDVIHLTTRHYADHRRAILADIRHRLKHQKPCRVIATSLIEAGVDVDFSAVWRAEAGLDSIAQAAGRCNREGRRDRSMSLVTIFTPAEVKPPREIKGLIGDKERALQALRREEDLLSLGAIERYFAEVYWRKNKEGLDRHKVLDAFRMTLTSTNFAYRRVGEAFRLIEDGMAPIVVARDPAAQAALAWLRSPDAKAGAIARRLQPFIVQVPPKARALLLAHQHVAFEAKERFGDQFCVLRSATLYNPSYGLLWEDPEYLALESNIL